MSLIGKSIPHDAAREHVTGEATYIDDLVPMRNELLADFVGSPLAHGRIKKIDVSAAGRVNGIIAVYTHADVPGENTFGPVFHDEELLAADVCHYVGQPIIVLAGTTRQAIKAAKASVCLEMEPLRAVLTIDEAIAKQQFIGPSRRVQRGDVAGAFANAQHLLEGTLKSGGQEHFYLEPQAALAIPSEAGQITIHSSTHNPTEIQAVVARCLGLRQNQVVCVCRRMGGGFGGKETQAAGPAILAALVAYKTRRPARIVLSCDQDMQVTGKRHPYHSNYKVSFADDGRITGLKVDFCSNGGFSADLSLAVMERTLLHAENAYFIANVEFTGTVCRTNLPSNTAFRGFGGPQAVAAMENIIEEIASYLNMDAYEVRRRNCYGVHDRNLTPYGQLVINNTLPALLERLAETSNYKERLAAIVAFNTTQQMPGSHAPAWEPAVPTPERGNEDGAAPAIPSPLPLWERVKGDGAAGRSNGRAPRPPSLSPWLKGMSLVPVKFGISFTRRTLNQANALVHIYLDGSIQVSTGGTEMGQGLNTKIRQLVADQFALPAQSVAVMPTSTEKNNNTSPTAASASTDLNGTAAVRACEVLRQRLADVAARHLASAREPGSQAELGNQEAAVHVIFENGTVFDRRKPDVRLGFDELVRLAYEQRVSLGERGFYATPGIDFNWETGTGNPFLYYTSGAAVAEVLVDRFTGDVKVTRVDILMDLGRSINPGIDRGQVIGGFMQGLGWVTTEELRYSAAGELWTHSPTTYKVPNITDLPPTFNINFVENHQNTVNIHASKAVGEPPLLLGVSVWTAVKHALSFVSAPLTLPSPPPSGGEGRVRGRVAKLNLPATNEEVMRVLAEHAKQEVPVVESQPGRERDDT
jgi:xanthine dehydrogenase large subunit